MSRTMKVAGGAALAGMMMTVAVVSASRRPEPAAPPPVARESAPDPITVDMRRCRTLTMPDSGCEAAWEAKRRRFFGKDEQ